MKMPDTDKQYYYKFSFKSKQTEALVAMLNELPFNGFEIIDEESVSGFIASADVDDAFREKIKTIKSHLPYDCTEQKVELENWNATWEKDFEPVIVADFCAVRADFHPIIANVLHEVIITPQMSFGTGHHETTRGMIEMMRGIDFKGKKVLDFGCGTGVLAILSAKLGAKNILGVDIDNNAYVNSCHNCLQNKVEHIQILKGDLALTDNQYDIILANINRHVILDTLPTLSSKLSQGSPLLISGILHSDMALLEKHLEKASFNIVKSLQNQDWMCILTEKV